VGIVNARMNRRSFLQTTSATAAWFALRPAHAAESAAKPSDDDLLAEARERIQRHRRGPGVVVVRDAAGKPVAGARVRVDQVRHEFLWGCNFFRFGRISDPEREAAYRRRFTDLLNFATLPFYWASYEPRRGEPGHERTERVLEWAPAHGLKCKGHPLVWDHPAGSPRWLPEDDEELERLSNARVRDCVARFKGRLDLWDVVNEATHLPDKANQTRMARWGEKLGSERYTRVPLELARAANPAATLLVNDYRIQPAYRRLLDTLRDDAGKLLYDAVGLQSHMHDGGWPLSRIWKVCDDYAGLGLPVHFTETTVVSGPRKGPGENWGATTPELEAKQADYVPKFYTLLFAHPAVQALTWWDFSDDGAWQGAAAGLVRTDMSPKPVYEHLHALIKGEWWTKATGETNAEGEYSANAFFGTQRVEVTLPGGRRVTEEVSWQSGKPNRVEMRA
jgi:GH35 family endo-1,4-beta-xylanase